MAYRKSCIMLFTLQQDCNTRKACKVVNCCKSCICCFPYVSRNYIPAKPCILLFTLQQDCNTRKACRLFIVVKVVQVVFHYKQELLSPRRFHFMVPFLAMAKFELCLSMAYRKSCIMLFTLQQDCNTRVACRLLFVVKVVQVVFPYSAGKHTRWLSTQQAAFHPHYISSHIIARVRTAAHPIAQRGGEKP